MTIDKDWIINNLVCPFIIGAATAFFTGVVIKFVWGMIQ